MVKRNVTFIYLKEHDKVRIEYGKIVKESVIPEDTNATADEFWNVYKKKVVPNPVVRKIVEEKQRGGRQTI